MNDGRAILAPIIREFELAIAIIVAGAHPGAVSVLISDVLHPVRAAIVSDVRVASLDGNELHIFTLFVLAVPDGSFLLTALLVAQLVPLSKKLRRSDSTENSPESLTSDTLFLLKLDHFKRIMIPIVHILRELYDLKG
uniref:Uncharacterized protein n=1 Tax=Anopheles farauti TaxID=69004 RepID=A0A182QRD1_9DIPT